LTSFYGDNYQKFKLKDGDCEEECTGLIADLLINSVNGNTSFSVTDGATYTTEELPSPLEFDAIVTGNGESVKFTVSGTINDQIVENFAPYNYPHTGAGGTTLGEGVYTINVKLFAENHAAGAVCDERTFTFTVEPPNICDNATDGGLIGFGLLTEEEICNPCAVPIIESQSAPSGGSGALEVVWLKRAGASIEDCQANFGLLEPFNVGELYDDFVAGNGPAQIGNTGWEFVTDNDSDDLSLTLN